jgi:hypothetical protein
MIDGWLSEFIFRAILMEVTKSLQTIVIHI